MPANHDYEFPGAAQYYAYFGPAAGEPGHGHYSFRVGEWLLVALNSEITIGAGSPQVRERFAPMDPRGREDPEGARQFIVGTGGAYVLPVGPATAGSEARNGETFGVLRLELEPGRYEWEFIPAVEGGFTDAGSASCR